MVIVRFSLSHLLLNFCDKKRLVVYLEIPPTYNNQLQLTEYFMNFIR